MNSIEKLIAKAVYDAMLAQARNLSIWNQLHLKRAYEKKLGFHDMPRDIQQAFLVVARAAVGELEKAASAAKDLAANVRIDG